MPKLTTIDLTRREGQIMEILYRNGKATAAEVQTAIPDGPGYSAVRALLRILEEKGHLKRCENGREVVYSPRESKQKAGRGAFQKVLETFFGGSLEEALAAHLHSRKDEVTSEERERLMTLIAQAKKEGR